MIPVRVADPRGWTTGWRPNAAEVVAWRRHIHAHPELSRHEYATTELIADGCARPG